MNYRRKKKELKNEVMKWRYALYLESQSKTRDYQGIYINLEQSYFNYLDFLNKPKKRKKYKNE